MEELEKEIIKQNQEDFSAKIFRKVKENRITHLEALSSVVEESQMEVEGIKKLLTRDLLAKIAIEAEDLSLIKKNKSRLKLI